MDVRKDTKLLTPRSSVENMSNEFRASPISEDKSLKNIEHGYNEQKIILIQLQERLDKEIENKHLLGMVRAKKL
jgi:hypothetical protein